MNLPRQPSSPSARTVRGFTLVELLVVIAVISILLLLLMPALGMVKGSARKVTCASNLRQLATGYIAYANNYEGALPVHRGSAAHQFNYAIMAGTSVCGFGLIANEFEIPPKVLYCPTVTQQSNQGLWLNGGSNVAPDPFYPLPANYPGNLRAGYSMTWGVPTNNLATWNQTVLSTQTPNPANLPSYGVTLPILTDLVGCRAFMAPMHLTGVNVAYGDGHTQWVYWSKMQAEYDAMPFNAFNASYNSVMEDYYLALGRQ